MVADPEPGSAAATTERLLAALELDEAGEAYAAVARIHARLLDRAQNVEGGALAAAIPGISREWRDTITVIQELTQSNDEYVAEILNGGTPVGDAEEPGSSDARW